MLGYFAVSIIHPTLTWTRQDLQPAYVIFQNEYTQRGAGRGGDDELGFIPKVL